MSENILVRGEKQQWRWTPPVFLCPAHINPAAGSWSHTCTWLTGRCQVTWPLLWGPEGQHTAQWRLWLTTLTWPTPSTWMYLRTPPGHHCSTPPSPSPSSSLLLQHLRRQHLSWCVSTFPHLPDGSGWIEASFRQVQRNWRKWQMIIRSHFASQDYKSALVPEHLHHPSHHAGPKHITQDEVSPKQLVLLILTCNLHWLLECSNLKNLQSTPSYSAQKIFNSLWSRFLQIKKSHCQVTVEMCTPWSPRNYWHENPEPRHKALGSSRKATATWNYAIGSWRERK